MPCAENPQIRRSAGILIKRNALLTEAEEREYNKQKNNKQEYKEQKNNKRKNNKRKNKKQE